MRKTTRSAYHRGSYQTRIGALLNPFALFTDSEDGTPLVITTDSEDGAVQLILIDTEDR